ncbi:conserved Plasmodium protein, unknown function [Plasmodium berghei]|uniref:ATP synthase-associated protein, putative n=2 Tax=Plasmodium berghei TaxID=5821 RepID=A0A509AHT3_PLABA|nr:ATP synthase-associated protein, putative [Plasmodium berghei ANKA]CXI40247.1 conserved Plasmodium protein, unknown function [Plasmodium berghei]SCM21790.1 conserved Plasmodium protein, unknown function [Plasmodium berghei]SCN25039.1 conserved Plasmodium protein, unknown function [Plasmodium berghei]SCO60079.1 conserved Plasmodium protein, unknown function [Plasmodium berghei]SCO61584.1 conserved Plasmodium protein, unknown function [Plasmodium berghei]|eukprot:XP_034421413.1 ATP synthase-associated protein, putative [Plasmodium berghei ANKA]
MILKDFFFQKPKVIKCEENVDDINKGSYAYDDNNTSNNDSIIDIIKKIPINPFIDSNENINKYKRSVEKKSIDRYTGVQVYDEDDEKDHKKNKPIDYPFPINKNVVFKKNKVNNSDERINTNYSNIASDLYPEEGFKTLNKNKHFSSDWELLLAHNHGLYHFKNNDNNAIMNKDMHSLNTENDIRNKLNLYTERINVDNPNDACKYLAIEEYKCLLTHSFHMNPNTSNQKCVKWFNEYMQCKWDEHKLNYGHNYIENRRNKKSKAYIAAPDYQYS